MRIRRSEKETNEAELLPNYSALTQALSRGGEGLKVFATIL